MTIQDIQNVQERNPGYLLNGSLSVPDDPENGHYQMIQAWIALGNTPDPAPAPPSPNPAIVEIERIAEMIPQTPQLVTLDADGQAIVTHDINSLWYAVQVTPLQDAMPNLHVTLEALCLTLAGGVAEGRVLVTITRLLPPVGEENRIFLTP
jgi:hypothetical protein